MTVRGCMSKYACVVKRIGTAMKVACASTVYGHLYECIRVHIFTLQCAVCPRITPADCDVCLHTPYTQKTCMNANKKNNIFMQKSTNIKSETYLNVKIVNN